MGCKLAILILREIDLKFLISPLKGVAQALYDRLETKVLSMMAMQTWLFTQFL